MVLKAGSGPAWGHLSQNLQYTIYPDLPALANAGGPGPTGGELGWHRQRGLGPGIRCAPPGEGRWTTISAKLNTYRHPDDGQGPVHRAAALGCLAPVPFGLRLKLGPDRRQDDVSYRRCDEEGRVSLVRVPGEKGGIPWVQVGIIGAHTVFLFASNGCMSRRACGATFPRPFRRIVGPRELH
jgi:hypothetical protein